MQPKGYYNWKLWFLLTAINCSVIIEKWPFNGWMTATVVAKLTQILWKKGWLQLLLEKANNLNKKMDSAIPGIKLYNTVTCKEKNVFLGTITSWINAVFYNFPADIYLFKVNKRNTRQRCEICWKLIIKTPERRQWRRSGIFIVNFEHILHLFYIAHFELVNVTWAALSKSFFCTPVNNFGDMFVNWWVGSFLSDYNWTRTHNHLVQKRKLNHCLKSKEKKKLYLSLFKIAADILN